MMALQSRGQNDSILPSDIPTDAMIDSLYREYFPDSTIKKDTLVPGKFVGYDKTIFRNSKAHLRKTLTASENPPIRKNLDNWIVFVWSMVIVLLLIFFKSNYPLQYRLLNKSWYSNISFNEFFSTQTSVFKNSKLLTWFIISQCVSLGIYIIIKASDISLKVNDMTLILLVSAGVIVLFTANQWLKNVFAYSFYQPGLSHDYAIIFRIQAYISSLLLLPLILLIYYNGAYHLDIVIMVIMITYIIMVYAVSLIKFIISGRILQNQSNFILILYLCAFEILPLVVLVKSISNLLEYD